MRNGFVLLAVLAMSLAPSIADSQCGPGGCRIPSYGSGGWRSAPHPSPSNPQMPGPPATPPAIPDAVKQCYEALVKISASPYGGSGTYIGGRVVVSCEHVFNGARGGVFCEFPSGKQIRVSQIHKDVSREFAVLLLDEDPGVAGIPLAEEPVQVGTRIWMAGYGTSRQLALTGGQVTNTSLWMNAYDPTRGGYKRQLAAQAQGTTYSGDSGGAWLTDDGQLIAVHWGGSDGSCYGTSEGLPQYVEACCQRWRIRFPCKRRPQVPEFPGNEEPEDKPEVPPAPAPPPKVDLGPIERSITSLGDRMDSRFSGVDSKLDSLGDKVAQNTQAITAIDVRVGVLEKPPDRQGVVFWAVILLAGVGAVFVGGVIYYVNE